MRTFTSEEVKYVLGHRKEILEGIQGKILMMYQELTDTDALLSEAAFPACAIREFRPSTGISDLGDVYHKYLQIKVRVSREQREIFWNLVEEEAAVNKLWHEFMRLPEPYYTLLYRLYVENNPYASVEQEMRCAHSSFERKRQKGLSMLLSLYEGQEKRANDKSGGREMLPMNC